MIWTFAYYTHVKEISILVLYLQRIRKLTEFILFIENAYVNMLHSCTLTSVILHFRICDRLLCDLCVFLWSLIKTLSAFLIWLPCSVFYLQSNWQIMELHWHFCFAGGSHSNSPICEHRILIRRIENILNAQCLVKFEKAIRKLSILFYIIL